VSDAPPGASEAPNLTPPPGNPRFPSFDALRAIAALSVFAGHTVTETTTFAAHPGRFVWAAQLADQGVAIFFLISGFLLYRPFLTARQRGASLAVGSYAKRRILRIVPAFWLAMTIFIVFGLVSGVTAGNWWIFYGFGQVYSAQLIGRGLGVAWTLGVEMSFYLLLPALVWLAGRLDRQREGFRGDVLVLVVLAAASLGFRAHESGFLQSQKVSTLAGTFFWFALGMGLAILSITRRSWNGFRFWPEVSWLLALLSFLAVHAVEANRPALGAAPTLVLSHILHGSAALFVLLPGVFAESAPGPARRVLRARLFAWIGLVSYGVYLYHSVVLAQLNKLFAGIPSGARYCLVVLIGLLVTAACAAASYYVLERPIMRMGRSAPRSVSRGSGEELA
jgi:peptidoglycan/LPS O-acetylase OafA/YrhL